MMKRAFSLALAILLAPSTVLALGPAFWGESFTPTAATAYTPQSVTFPTSADYLSRAGSTFSGDSNVITVAVAFETPATFSTGRQQIYGLQQRIQVTKDTVTGSHYAAVELKNSSNTLIYAQKSTTTLLPSTKYCLLFSARLDGTPVSHMYLNGADVEGTGGTDPAASETIDYTLTTGESIGQYVSGGNHFTGLKVGPFWMGQQYVDFSSGTERAKFCDGSNDPVYWGADGSTPTGVQPGRVNYWPATGGRLVNAGSLTSPTYDFTAAGSPTYGDW